MYAAAKNLPNIFRGAKKMKKLYMPDIFRNPFGKYRVQKRIKTGKLFSRIITANSHLAVR